MSETPCDFHYLIQKAHSIKLKRETLSDVLNSSIQLLVIVECFFISCYQL